MTLAETLVNGIFNGCGSAIGSYLALTYAIKNIERVTKKTKRIIKKARR